METFFIPLYYICATAGLVMVVGGIWLIYKQKIYIDRESNQVTEIETPFGKFKTNFPALVLFFIGFLFLMCPIIITMEIKKEIKIIGNVKSTIHPVQIYAVSETDSLMQDRDFILRVPSSIKDYKIVYIAKDIILEDMADPSKKIGGAIRLSNKEIVSNTTQFFEPTVSSIPQKYR